jgi:HEAT repeat protein
MKNFSRIILFGMIITAATVFAQSVSDLNTAKDEKTIIAAADWAGSKQEKAAIPNLINLLDDSRESVRINAVTALGYIGDESAVDAVNKCFLNDQSAEVRYAGILASFRIGSKNSISSWKQAKDRESDPYILDVLKKLEEKATGK